MAKQTTLLFQKNTVDGSVEVWNEKPLRWLSINGIEQTRIDTEHPQQLASSVHRYFLAVLLFIETPEKVLLGGLGGGALARFLHNKHPEISGDAVEINETIAQLAQDYFYFPKTQWKIIVDDFRQWKKTDYDLIIADIAEGDLTPPWLSSQKMLQQLKSQLSKHGVLIIDLLVDDAKTFTETLSEVRKVFKRQTLCLSVPEHKNIILFAFNQPPANNFIDALDQRAKSLTALWGLEYSAFVEQLKKDNPKNSGVF